MDLAGTWKGFYQYCDGYKLPQFGQKVNFTLKITEFNNNKFNGFTLEEESEFSIPEKGIVSGFINDKLISFIKKYPNNSEKLRTSSQEYVIEHTGSIDLNEESIYGMWFISETIFENYEPIDISYEGIWILKKQ